MLVTILQFLLSLSILIILHECGHFFPAKWFKTKVEKFYLFFDPYFSLFKIKKGETEYGIGWLPLGGYVKISGMIDESFDTEQMAKEPQPWEFRSKPAWQRLIIMLGGVTVNFILGILLFCIILFTWGERYLPTSALNEGIYVDSLGYQMGLRDGDKVLSIGDQVFDKFNPGTIVKEVAINGAKTIQVERNGTIQDIEIDEKFSHILTSYENRGADIIGARFPAIVDSIDVKSPAKAGKAGIKKGDRLIGVNGVSVNYYHEFEREILASKSEKTDLSLLRGNDTITVNYTTQFKREKGLFAKLFSPKTPEGTRLRIGFLPKSMSQHFKYEAQKFGIGESIVGGWNKSTTFLTDQIKAFGQIFRGKVKAKDSLGSFISIGKMFGNEWNWQRFWGMTAMLSLLLGFLNLLPIPALDGGHVLFLIYEVITGRKPSDKFLEYATFFGFVLLMSLMAYALFLDISRII